MKLRGTRAFALPTVLIVSIVMLMVLTVSVSATASTRQGLLTQYYTQLAQVAGDAGTAYAKACLAANGNIPTWDDLHPLTPKTNCSGVDQSGYPDYVAGYKSDDSLSFNDIRSSFSVGLPSLDSDGRAVTIPNSGYVNLLRTSTQEVWKTYSQPGFQSAVVPDLCSNGEASTGNGWVSAVSTTGTTFSEPTAQAISSVNGPVGTGSVYYRKDFTVSDSGSYTLSTLTQGYAVYFIDGKYAQFSSGGNASSAHTLDPGCHTLYVQLNNAGASPVPTWFKLSLKTASSSSPVVVSDTSWRYSAGALVDFSSNNFDTLGWVAPRVLGYYNSSPWTNGPTNWLTVTGDSSARWLATTSYAAGSYPATSWSYYRSIAPWLNSSSATSYQISAACDDLCNIYIDGNLVMSTASWNVVGSATITLSEGPHSIGVELYNNGAGASGFLFSAKRVSDGAVVAQSNNVGWVSSNSWTSTQQVNSLYSYSTDHTPIPWLATAPAKVLVVGGGGSGGGSTGGGGGGGGVLNLTDVPLSPGIYPVTVGAGGAAPGASAMGNNGGNSSFGLLLAIGGGGGGWSANGNNGTSGSIGGSGGGGQSYTAVNISALGTIDQGNAGSASVPANGTAGGGGAGGVGTTSGGSAQYGGRNGGPGLLSTITGSSVYYGGGGGGGAGGSAGNGGAGGTGGGGAGARYTGTAETGVAGTANTGGGGGGGWAHASGNGGAGGSGVVIIAYPTGSITASGGTVTTSGGYTIHRFAGVGTNIFTVTSIN